MSVEVYSKPGCGPCMATYRALDKEGVEYQKFDVSQDEDAREVAIGLGHQESPVVVVRVDGEIVNHWSGFSLDNIKELSA